MHLDPRGCVQCPTALPACNPGCASNQRCDLIVQTCSTCATAICNTVAQAASKDDKSIPPGAVAGATFGALAIVVMTVGFVYYRRRRANLAAALKRTETAVIDIKPDVVAKAETVLGRPDPIEKPPIPLVADPVQPPLVNPSIRPDNPFADHASIATASDRATNAIPIAYMAPIGIDQASVAATANTPGSISTAQSIGSVDTSGQPIRPHRNGPEIDMRLNPSRPVSNASSLLVPPKAPYAPSARSGDSSRSSIISTSSSLLNEAPQIVTPLKGSFKKQVLNVQKAEVVQLGNGNNLLQAPQASNSVRSSKATHATSIRSPLGQAAFNADDVSSKDSGSEGGHHNPFSDKYSEPGTAASTNSASTFGAQQQETIAAGNWDPSESRPTSTFSYNGSIVADITPVTRLQFAKPITTRSSASSLAAQPSHTTPPSPRTPTDFRSAGQLTPPVQRIPKSFDDMMGGRRMSEASLATTNRTSVADSVLEAFPFVPPSPMSMAHSQPPTPMSAQSMQKQQERPLISAQPPTPTAFTPPPPSRSTLGMSVMSASSTGLGAFPFQIQTSSFDDPPTPEAGDRPLP